MEADIEDREQDVKRRAMVAAGTALTVASLTGGRAIAQTPAPQPSGRRAVVWNRIPTAQPVAFITIDDGYFCDPQAMAYVEQHQLPVTPFLSVNAVPVFDNPAYFKRYQAVGRNVIQSHGAPHDDLRGKPYAVQYAELDWAASEIDRIYGTRPVAFRPPYGQFDDNTLKAAYDTGAKWLIRWTHAMVGGVLVNECGGVDSQPMCGDILLCHFDAGPSLHHQIRTAYEAIVGAGLRPANLISYLMEYPT